jgi:hypothetical protein
LASEKRHTAAKPAFHLAFTLRRSSFPRAHYRSLALLVLLALLAALPMLGHAQDDPPNRAGVVILHGDGRVVTACVSFGEPQITGLELLSRANLAFVAQSGGGGSAVCKLDGEGCDYPTEDCFCKCKGAECVYWAYQHLRGGQWSYAQIGAGAATIRPGDVDGWAWGAGTVQAGAQPPAISLDQICAAPAAEPPTLPAPIIVPPTEPAPEASAPTVAPAAPTEAPPPSPPPVVRPSRTPVPAPTAVVRPAATAIPADAPTAVPTALLPATAPPSIRPTARPTVAPPTSAPAAASATLSGAGGVAATPVAPTSGGTGAATSYLIFGAIVLALIGGIAASTLMRRR